MRSASGEAFQAMNTHPDNFNFSTPLKLRLVAYFRKYYDLDIKDEEADLFLRSLATVYDSLSRNPRLTPPALPSQTDGAVREGAAGFSPRTRPSPGVRNTGGTMPNAT